MPWICCRSQTIWLIFSLLLHILPSGAYTYHSDKVSADGKYFKFASRPDIQAPVWDITTNNDTLVGEGYWLIAPYEIVTQEEPVHGWVGPYIYDNTGELVWSGTPMFQRWNVFDFGVANVSGQPHLTLLDWHMQRGVALDYSYQIQRTTPMFGPGDTFQNMHAFHVIDDGKRALTLSNRWTFTDKDAAATVNFDGICKANYEGFRAFNIESEHPQTTFEWNGKDHIALNESKFADDVHYYCRTGWDLMHTNAIDIFPDGDYLLSARHTDTLYKISHVTGEIVWRLGGVSSDFKLLQGAAFSRQHHGTVLSQNSTHTIISLFDNAKGADSQFSTRSSSRGLKLSLDLRQMTAAPLAQYRHPRADLIDGRGSFQVLPNGNAFIGWAEASRISEHTADGVLLMEANLVAGHDTYRAFKFPWVGRPSQRPDIYSEVKWEGHRTFTEVHMSWNGATEVATWNINGNDADGNAVQLGSVPRTGFETLFRYDGFASNVYVEAIDQDGEFLGTSDSAMISKELENNDTDHNGPDHNKPADNIFVFTVCLFGFTCVLALFAATIFVKVRWRMHSKAAVDHGKGTYELVKADDPQEDPS